MTKMNKESLAGLTKDKKELMKSIMGKYSASIDLNKIRDDYRNDIEVLK